MSGVSILLHPVGGERGEEDEAADDEAVVEVTSDLCVLVPASPAASPRRSTALSRVDGER